MTVLTLLLQPQLQEAARCEIQETPKEKERTDGVGSCHGKSICREESHQNPSSNRLERRRVIHRYNNTSSNQPGPTQFTQDHDPGPHSWSPRQHHHITCYQKELQRKHPRYPNGFRVWCRVKVVMN